jgi:N-acetylneuraminic acid mutarotase
MSLAALAQVPPQGYWNTATALPFPASEQVAAILGDKMYVFGARNWASAPHNQVWEYNFGSQVWSRKADMPTGRGEAACAVVDGKIYVFGGNDEYGNHWLTSAECYDPATDEWTQLSPIPGAPRGWLSAAAVAGTIYVMGGLDSYVAPTYNDNFIYDPARDTWSTGAALPVPRSHHGAAVLDGKVYLVGGEYRLDNAGPTYAVVQTDIYDPATNTWSLGAPISHEREALCVANLHDRLYALGGKLPGGGPAVAVVEEYDPRDDYWRVVTHLPEIRYAAACATDGHELYLLGGRDGLSNETEYNSVLVGLPRPIHGDINNDGDADFRDINPFVYLLTHADHTAW